MKMSKLRCFSLVALLMTTGPAMAALIVGTVAIQGSGVLDTAPSATLPGATQLTMDSVGMVAGGSVSPSGDFATFLSPFDTAYFNTTTITFDPTFTPSPISGFWTGGGFSFELRSLLELTEINGFINLAGLGIITGNGFSATTGRIQITGTGFNTDIAISTTTAVPEPFTLGLIGLGLVGFGITRKMRSKKAA